MAKHKLSLSALASTCSMNVRVAKRRRDFDSLQRENLLSGYEIIRATNRILPYNVALCATTYRKLLLVLLGQLEAKMASWKIKNANPLVRFKAKRNISEKKKIFLTMIYRFLESFPPLVILYSIIFKQIYSLPSCLLRHLVKQDFSTDTYFSWYNSYS